MSRSRILLTALALGGAGYLASSVNRVPADQIAVRDSAIFGTTPVAVSPGWHLVPRGLFRLTRYPADLAAYDFGQAEPLTFTTPAGSKVLGSGRLEYEIASGEVAILHARCGGDIDRWLLEKVRETLTRIISDAAFSPLTAAKVPQAEIAGQRILSTVVGADGLQIRSIRFDRLGYEGSAAAIPGAPRAGVHRKVLWFAVDSFDWAIARPLVDAGRMPKLKRLMDAGAWGNLQSIMPMLSPVIWTSVATGKRPEKHGILDFVATDPQTGATLPVTSTLRKSRAFWNILSDGGVSVGVVAWWATFPAEQVNGFIATDRISYQLFKGRIKKDEAADDPFKTSPAELYRQIAPLIKAPAAVTTADLSRFVDVGRYAPLFSPDDKERVQEFATAVAASHTYTDVARKLFSERPTELRVVYFEGPDEASHQFMPFVPPPIKTVDGSKAAWFGGVVPEYYVYQDELIGEFLLAFADDDTTVIVSSDHGFRTGDGRPETESRISHGKAADWHAWNGMILLAGKDINKGARIVGATVLDILPTLLLLYGMPIGEDMDGKPLTMALSAEFLASHQPTQIATYESGERQQAAPAAMASEEDEELLAKLRSLGYIQQDKPGAVLNEATAFMQSGEYEKAIAGFEAALRRKDNPELRYTLARAYRLNGQPDQAIEQLDLLMKEGWGKTDVLNELSLISRERKDFKGAEGLLRQALEADPNLAQAHLNRARLYAQQKRWDDALASYRRAAQLDPNSGEAFSQIGVVLKLLGRVDEAVEALQQATKLNPDLMAPYNNLGLIYRETGQLGKAREVLTLGASMAPKSPVIHNTLGSLYYDQGEVENAAKEFEIVLALDPNHPGALSNLAVIYMDRGDSAQSAKYLSRLVEVEPGNSGARTSLALSLLEMKKTDEAKRLLVDLLAKEPRNHEAMMILGEVELASGDPGEAVRLLVRAGELEGNNPCLWNDLAHCYLAMGRKEEARQALRRSLAVDPRQPDVSRKLAEMGG